YPALSLALVNVEATLDGLEARKRLARDDLARLRAAARMLFYKERTWPAILDGAAMTENRAGLLQLLLAENVDRKREDAIALLAVLRDFSPQGPAKRGDWTFRAT